MGRSLLYLTPLEWLDRVAVLIPPPRRPSPSLSRAPRPYVPLRVAVTARAGLPVERPVHDTPLQAATEAQEEPDAQPRPRAGYLWAMLLARIL